MPLERKRRGKKKKKKTDINFLALEPSPLAAPASMNVFLYQNNWVLLMDVACEAAIKLMGPSSAAFFGPRCAAASTGGEEGRSIIVNY